VAESNGNRPIAVCAHAQDKFGKKAARNNVLYITPRRSAVKLQCIAMPITIFFSFSALHGMPEWTSDEKGASVRPSVCQTRALWQNGRKICPDFFIQYER